MIKDKIYKHATQTLGFDDCKFTDPKLNGEMKHYDDWLSNNFHGNMEYLSNHRKFKENPNLLLDGVKSAIVLIKNYKNTDKQKLEGDYKIARYAVGRDYHNIMKGKLEALVKFIRTQNPHAECYAGVDSRPVSERSLALKSGIGFLGKNTMVIKPGLGSYFFIGVILVTEEIEPDPALEWNCGQCRLCIDACPTDAILENSTLDATKCISYMTIEKKEPLTDEEIKKTGGWLFGCDICQEVCPYNSETVPLTEWAPFLPEAGIGFDYLANMAGSPEMSKIPKDSPIYRSKKRVVPNIKRAKELYTLR